MTFGRSAPKVILGYRDWPGTHCPYCGGSYGAIEDDGITSKYLYRCWCGATARVAKDDPDILAAIGASRPVVSATVTAKGSSQHNEGGTKAQSAGRDNG
jgi:hypothetical protein